MCAKMMMMMKSEVRLTHVKFIGILVWILLCLHPIHSVGLIEEKVCIGTNGRMSVPSNREHHYQNLRDRYTNCTYVDGNLELTWLQDETLDLSFLQYIREVTGYVLISHVDVKRIVLPNLQIIRGRTLFKLNVRDEEFALMVTLSQMENLEMPALRDVLSGSVGFFNNYNLCHIRTINWEEILTGTRAKTIYVYNFTEPERECPSCHESCQDGCWGEGPHNCQQFSKINCASQCHQGRCFGPNPRECCHLFCAGGCKGPKQSDCLACRNFYDGGVCKQECPPMMRYNPSTYSWEVNPEGKYAYGATCVKDCPEHLLKDNGACVRSCPPNKKSHNGECVPCDGPCPKNCLGVDVVHAGNIESFRGCTVIEGSLTILDSSFEGFQEVYPNFTFGPRHPKMHPERLEVFKTLQDVTGYVSIQASHPDFQNLSYFRNLETIGGRQLTEYFAALYIVKSSLVSLNLRSLKRVRSGSIAILENKDLCFAKSIDWKQVARSTAQNILLQSNGDEEMCRGKNLVCHPQCGNDGCWGPGAEECLSCRSYRLDETCIESCNSSLGIYDAGSQICKPCHEECLGECYGPGAKNCSTCKHVRDGPYCVPECPLSKFNNHGECEFCHENCIGGCSGSLNKLGQGGCNSCEKAIVSMYNPNVVEECLKAEESCPDGFYHEYIGPQEEGPLKSLTGKSVCRKCHQRCKNCTAYGIHISVCDCLKYSSSEQCEDQCPRDYYADEQNHKCVKCADECSKGCTGPTSSDCIACRNYRVYSSDRKQFNCTASCPPEKPFKVFTDKMEDPYCSEEDPAAASWASTDEEYFTAILGSVIGCVAIFVVFMAIFSWQWLQRAKSKENTMKLTMRMSGFDDNEPLKVTNVKPNLAKLRIVKEAELRKGGIMGYGAFGTVYKGVWIPENENVKIPVAIKVLREGTQPNMNKEFLEEAYIMASVDHPNLLKLLAVCMTSQLMLVTQLMPLGCLLDYVRNNKNKIGSKPLLNWCTQIARGMAYLEEKRMVHRDLALRNVLLQTPGCVKITDFGLAKLLDINEDEYKAAGGKMPIKWLALECIQHRIFTHKSDVWAFGVTVWELLTYGGRPYENIPAREVPDLLEKGERLPQPAICTIDVYMIMIKCWMLDAESRPTFKELAEEFAKMARDPGRYLVINGDELMRLPSYTPQDEKELIKNLSMPIEGPEVIMDAEEYLQPTKEETSSSETPPPPTPIKKFMEDRGFDGDPIPGSFSSQMTSDMSSVNCCLYRENYLACGSDRLKYSHLEKCLHSGPHAVNQSRASGLISNRYCSDPLKLHWKAEHDARDMFFYNPMAGHDPNVPLPVDEDDYLMPSPSLRGRSSGYVDLISDSSKLSDDSRIKNHHPPISAFCGVDNIEYHFMSNPAHHYVNTMHTPLPSDEIDLPNPSSTRGLHVIQPRFSGSDEPIEEHEYYNSYDRLPRELQPLTQLRNETTV